MIKADNSPVTSADIAANGYIVNELTALGHQLSIKPQIIAEETENACIQSVQDYFWLVDPLDGTASFIRQEDQFTVNIALIKRNQPILGVIYIPVTAEMYFATKTIGAHKMLRNQASQPICARRIPAEGATVLAGSSIANKNTREYIKQIKLDRLMQTASSLKFCMLAEGVADIYPRFGDTMEWDTAAGQIILQMAGGKVMTTDGTPLTYGKAGYRNPHFIACGEN